MSVLAPLAITAGSSLLSGLLGGGNDYEDILRAQQAKLEGIPLPELEAFQFNPESYQYSTVSEDPALQARQAALIDRLGQLGETGLSEADKASYSQGINQANQAARQRSGALMNEMRARGQGGSGLEYALREQAGQEALGRQAQQGLAQAGDSARQRALYQQAYGNALSGQRDQDYRAKAANTDVINRFNQLNTGARNEAALGNLNRKNEVAQQGYANQLSKYNAGNTAAGNLAQAGAASSASRNAMINSLIGAGAQAGMGVAGYGPWADKEKKEEKK